MKRTLGKVFLLLLTLALIVSLAVSCNSDNNPAQNGDDTSNNGGTPNNGETPDDGGNTQPPVETPEEAFAKLSEREKAFYLLNFEESDLFELASFTQTATLQATGSYMDVPFEIMQNLTLVYGGLNDPDQYFYIQSTQGDYSFAEGAYGYSVDGKEGYVDGKMFYFSNEDGKTTALYSLLGAEDYAAHQKNTADDTDILAYITDANCGTVTCSKLIDGRYSVTFTDFTESALKGLLSELGDFNEFFASPITDIDINFTVSKDFIPQTMHFAFAFEDASASDTFVMDIAFSNVNSTVKEHIDFSGYTKVDDLRNFDIVKKALDDAGKAEELSFDFSASTVLTNGVDKNETKESHTIAIENKEQYTFNIAADVGGTKATIVYQNGAMKTTVPGQGENSQAMTEAQAKAEMDFYLDPGSFSQSDISTAKKNGELYTFKIDRSDLGKFSSFLASVSADEDDVTSIDGVYTVSLKDGKIEAFSYSITVSFTSPYGNLTLIYTAEADNFAY